MSPYNLLFTGYSISLLKLYIVVKFARYASLLENGTLWYVSLTTTKPAGKRCLPAGLVMVRDTNHNDQFSKSKAYLTNLTTT